MSDGAEVSTEVRRFGLCSPASHKWTTSPIAPRILSRLVAVLAAGKPIVVDVAVTDGPRPDDGTVLFRRRYRSAPPPRIARWFGYRPDMESVVFELDPGQPSFTAELLHEGDFYTYPLPPGDLASAPDPHRDFVRFEATVRELGWALYQDTGFPHLMLSCPSGEVGVVMTSVRRVFEQEGVALTVDEYRDGRRVLLESDPG